MKKTIRKGISLLALCTIGFTSQAQGLIATPLEFTNHDPVTEHEFGFSTAAFEGYSMYGTQFNETINIYKGNSFLFRAVSPTYHQALSPSFGHAVAITYDWMAASAFQDDLTPADPNTFNHGRVYLSKSLNGVPQNNFTTAIQAQTPFNRDRYGESLDMSGNWLVVGAPSIDPNQKGYIEIWKQTATSWERKQKIQAGDLPLGARFGYSVAIHGDYLVVGAPNAQKVYVYKNTSNVWSLHSSYTPDLSTWAGAGNYNAHTNTYNSQFGFDVDIYENSIIVGDGSTSVQKAAILTINASTTTLSHTLLPPGYSETSFTHYGGYGQSVAIGENKALVGAPVQYGPDITDRYLEGKAFFYESGSYKGYMNAISPAGKEIRGLGKSVTIDGEHAIVGAENTNNLVTPRMNEGLAFRMPFYYVSATGNTPPSASIISPDINANLTAPATVSIQAYANDVDGTISNVEFYLGGTYAGSDNTAPYTLTVTNVAAGNKYVYVKAYDNQGSFGIGDGFFSIKSALPLADISGPVCGSKNQTLLFELDAAKRVHATGFNWYYTGSNQGLTPVSGSSYKVNLATGNNFSAGQLCVGVNYSSAPWHATYCINVATCSALREGAVEDASTAVPAKSLSYPNPFNTTSTIEFGDRNTAANIQVLDAAGVVVMKTQATGSFIFGSDLNPGVYLVVVEFADKTESIKVVKE